MRAFFLLALLALSAPAFAQTAKPQKPATEDEQPALDAKAQNPKGGLGATIIIGDDESPLGLYLTPWRESRAENNIDRPSRLLQEEVLPIDKDVFERQVEYYDALSNAAQRKARVK